MKPIQLALLIGLLAASSISIADEISPEQLQFFETKIRPVLIKECYGCHSNKAGNVRGGLRLDTRELTYIGGSSGPAVVPGDTEQSLLLTAMEHIDFEMPPKRKLPEAILEDFRVWIKMGAPDPRTTKLAEIRSTIGKDDIQHARETFWAYQKPVAVDPPSVANTEWTDTAIDQFVLSKLESANLQPSSDAVASKVLRRLCHDLVGLPPTAKQINYFNKIWMQDPSEAVEFVVDQLLENEQYGERWGRHWLDVARYAESTGREVNMTYPHAWRYRDYVIDSFNDDKPFNQFVQEQIAGDLLPAATDEQWAEQLVATTFLAIGPKNVNEQNPVQFKADVVDEQIDATTRVFLGMSVSCARCHDHKFDAIPQSDYYALAGVFRNITTYFGNPPSEFGAFSTPQRRRSSSLIRLPVDDPNPYDPTYSPDELESLKSELTDTMASAAQTRRNMSSANAAQSQRNRIMTANKLASISDKLAVVDEDGSPYTFCMGVLEKSDPQDAQLLVRGEIDQAAQTVRRGFPQVLCSTPAEIPLSKSGRLQFARFIGSADNTLTARVMANRVWQHLMGRGIVTSTENFGVTGQAPSHPELLDYLAVRLVDSGWSIKNLVREIATSRVYRIDSTYDKASHEKDPDNAMLWRANPRRQDAEALRDAMLSIGGELDLERPRGSEVAKAGYTRVRGGVLGDPREIARKSFQNGDLRNLLAGGSGGRPSMRNRRGRGGFDRFPSGLSQAIQRPGKTREEVLAGIADKVTNQLDMQDAKFRSVYLPIVRDEIPRSLEVFDFADASAIAGTRESSNTPDQALYMLNNPFVIEQADMFAQRVSNATSSVAEQLDLAFLLAYARPPTSREKTMALQYMRSTGGGGRTSRSTNSKALSALCQSLLASAEFRFID